MNSLDMKSVQYSDGIVVLVLEGGLDGRTAPQLEQVLVGCLDAGRSRIAVDLDRLEVLTSAGAGVFIGALVQAQEVGGDVMLVRPRPQVRQILELLGLGQVFSMPPDLGQAADDLRRPGRRILELEA